MAGPMKNCALLNVKSHPPMKNHTSLDEKSYEEPRSMIFSIRRGRQHEAPTAKKQLNGHKKTNVTYTKSLTKKLNPGPHKNTNGTRQKRKVHGTGPNGNDTKRKRQ